MRNKKELVQLSKKYEVLGKGCIPLTEDEIDKIIDQYPEIEGYELKIVLQYLKGCYKKHREKIEAAETERSYKAMCAAHGCRS